MSTLRIHLLGEFRLQRDGVALQLPTQKARALLAYLVTYRDRAHPRAVLAGLLWGEMPEDRAHRNLADTLWRIRQIIGRGYILAHQQTLRFNQDADYWLDVEEFETVSKQVAGRQVDKDAPPLSTYPLSTCLLELYRGDFLEGFYDDWCLLERERLRALYLAALRALLAHHKERGDHGEALRYGQRLVVSDPLREEAHREVMQLLALLGRRNAALRQYLVCRRTLAEELGVEPLPETTALYHQIRQAVVARSLAQTAPSPTDLGRVPLVGREAERASALARLEAAIQGHGGALLIEGEAGAGKTRLVDEIVTGARWRDVTVGFGRGEDLAEPPAYGPLTTALRGVLTPLRAAQLRRVVDVVWLREVSTLLPEIAEWLPDSLRSPPRAELPSDQAQERLLNGLAQVLQGLGRVAPHLLILEDLHWADAATLEALGALVPRLRPARVLALITVRPEDTAARPTVRETLQALDRGGTLDRIPLPRLTADEVAEFIRRALGESPADLADRLYQETAGNPLFLVETLTAWRDEGLLLAERPGQWVWHAPGEAVGPVDVPTGIRVVIQQRLDRLTRPARQVLDVATVVGIDVDFEVLDDLCALPGETCLTALEELVRWRVLVEEAAGYRFSHDRVRQVAYESLSSTRRQDLHRQVGEALEARSPARIETLAHHFWQGQVWDKAVEYALAAADRARQVYATDVALAHYNRVVELGPEAGDRLPQALLRRSQVWELLGQYDRALQDCAALHRWGQEHDDAATMSQALDRSGWYHCLRGELDQGLADAQQARIQAERAGDARTLADALSTAGALHGSRGDFDQALALFHRALALASERDDTAEIARLWHNIGATHLLRGDNDDALAAFDQALARRRALGNRRDVSRTLTNIGHIHYNQGDLAAAQVAFEESLAIWQELALRADSTLARIGLGAVQMRRGHLTEAIRTFEEALAIVRECGDRQHAVMIEQDLGDIFTSQGRLAEARGVLESARAQAQESGLSSQAAYTLSRLGHLYLVLFAGPPARACYEEAEAILGGEGHKHDETLIQKGLGLAWLVSGDTEKARRHLERAATLAPDRVARLLVAIDLATLDLASGAPAEAQARAVEAAQQADALGWVELAAQAHQQQGEALLALGRAEEAAAALRQALAIADEVGLPAIQWPVLAALGRAYQAQGQLSLARDALARAIRIVEVLTENIDDETLRAGFLDAGPIRQLRHEQAALGRQVRVRLARPEAPTGRPLTDDERVGVLWTVDAGEPDAVRLAAEGKVALRRARIRRLLDEAAAQDGVPTERDLAEALGVTPRTIRSDVAALREAGHRVRTRGAA